MPEDNNIDDLSISEILDLYKDTLTTKDNLISAICRNVSKLQDPGGVPRVGNNV